MFQEALQPWPSWKPASLDEALVYLEHVDERQSVFLPHGACDHAGLGQFPILFII